MIYDGLPLLVVDAANVVGSVPDGWWRDRAGAARRLRDALVAVARHGLPGATLAPPVEVVMVVEGAARGIGSVADVTVVDASRSGELAHSTGTYELSYNDPSGRPVTDRGNYLAVWRRQADGSWKMVVESFNSDSPPPGAASH